ncbi:LacI family DNA-binding transcriptional regulator [Qipengyuania sp. 6B39]|uniref:LacI family DNA-binding transcriptional regulator n=1 Tax=Qipengyuania proteolytica TaxID=2867239 RepID=UPI001C88E63B|nr:LacI family DNA-binding transcriptional regulator [Qipengyuania proteolytica]MBX7496902.1 LacI family DNA-binding transcriptional regulator [Qipengyuania proteolytica]
MPNSQNGRPRRVTSIDVAERAGVSQSTVSRALSGSETITEATRRRVEQAAAELGYHVNARAAGLRRGETGTIAIVVIGRAGQGAASVNPFYYSMLGSTCAAAADRGYEALVSFQAEPEEFFGHYVARRQADGVVVIGTATNAEAWDYFRDCAKETDHIAFWGSPFDDATWVRSDNREGGRIAVERLVKGGAKDIVFVGDTHSSQRQFSERYEGYKAAMEAQGLAPREPIVSEGEDRVSQGRNSVAALIESGEKFDGLFFACDAMALGALEEMASRGIAVPGNVGVIGFDGLGSGEFSAPPLTTVEPDFATAGKLLVDTALAGEGEKPERRVPVRLVERASIG